MKDLRRKYSDAQISWWRKLRAEGMKFCKIARLEGVPVNAVQYWTDSSMKSIRLKGTLKYHHKTKHTKEHKEKQKVYSKRWIQQRIGMWMYDGSQTQLQLSKPSSPPPITTRTYDHQTIHQEGD